MKKLQSTHAVAIVRYGEKKKHLYRYDDDPIDFFANEQAAIAEARSWTDCDSNEMVVVMKIEYLFVPKPRVLEERRVTPGEEGR